MLASLLKYVTKIKVKWCTQLTNEEIIQSESKKNVWYTPD
jgi:hypothetical protein